MRVVVVVVVLILVTWENKVNSFNQLKWGDWVFKFGVGFDKTQLEEEQHRRISH